MSFYEYIRLAKLNREAKLTWLSKVRSQWAILGCYDDVSNRYVDHLANKAFSLKDKLQIREKEILQLDIPHPFFASNHLEIENTNGPSEALSTLIRFQTKTELFYSGYSHRPHYNAENDHRKRSHLKTLSRVERFKNDVN